MCVAVLDYLRASFWKLPNTFSLNSSQADNCSANLNFISSRCKITSTKLQSHIEVIRFPRRTIYHVTWRGVRDVTAECVASFQGTRQFVRHTLFIIWQLAVRIEMNWCGYISGKARRPNIYRPAGGNKMSSSMDTANVVAAAELRCCL